MSKYQINGGMYEVDDSLKGDDLNNTLQQLADVTAQQNQQKFLGLLKSAEGGAYDLIHGPAGQRFTDFTTHPNVVGARTADGPSTAAGAYGITARTYYENQAAAGVNDFTPESQDKLALHLIASKGAADDVSSGNFTAAINKLGGVWASLPSSHYGQAHRSWDWVNAQLGQTGATTPVSPADATPQPQAAPTTQNADAVQSDPWYVIGGLKGWSPFNGVPKGSKLEAQYQQQEALEKPSLAPQDGFGAIQEKADPSTFYQNQDWLKAAAQLYQYKERQPWKGSDSDLAAYGLTAMGRFSNNTAVMAFDAHQLADHGTAQDKQAFLYLMNQYDNTKYSWSGAGRAVTAMTYDPMTWAGVGTLGTSTLAKIAASTPEKAAVRRILLTSLGRSGIPGAIIGGVQGGVSDTIHQNINIDAGVQKDFSTGEVAAHAAAGGAVGGILGTAADAALTAAKPAVKWVSDLISRMRGVGQEVPQVVKPGAATAVSEAVNPEAIAQHIEAVTNSNPATATTKAVTPAQAATAAAMMGLTEHAHAEAHTPAPDVSPLPTPHDGIGAPETGLPTPPEPTLGQPRTVVNDTAPFSTILTQEEVDAVTTRGQKGRLWTDEIPHDNDLPRNETVARNLEIPPQTEGLRATGINGADEGGKMARLNGDAEKVAAQLRGLDTSTLRQTLEALRSITTLKDVPVVFRAIQMLHDEVRVAQAEILKKINAQPESAEMPKWIETSNQLDARRVDIGLADDAMGSFGGSLNRQRQEGLMGLQGHTPESIAATHGVDIETATAMWQKTVDAALVSQKAKEVAGVYDGKVADALDKGDFGAVAQLFAQKRRELNGIGEEAAPGGSSFLAGIFSPSAWLHGLHSTMGKIRELFISNLFSVGTLVVNGVPSIVKTLAIPVARAIVSDITKLETRVELGANYSAMQATFRSALEKAWAGFKYEQAILTKDSGRLMEGEMAMTGRVGGALRIFPRLLTASDEFLANINYSSYVLGRAANKATIEGTAKGLTGKALEDYARLNVEIAKHTMYTIKGAGQQGEDALLQPIVNKGVNLGYSGETLQAYVEKEAAANGKSLGFGSDKEALTFARDVLYKRAFAGDGKGGWFKRESSNIAAGAEKMLRGGPELSLLVGQLFFRTPIRVFEEGIRMTPGVQILAPGFMRDLAGANGVQRQIRAQSESLVAVGFAGAVLSLYSQGRITASGVYMNANQEKVRKDGPGTPQNSIVFKDGTSWSYNKLDLIAIPMKIMTNALEGWDELTIKEAQEQYVNQPARRLIMARLSVATMAIAQAFKDSNLVSGLNGTINLGKELADPEGDEAAIIKKFGSEMAMFVPNTLHKIAQANDPAVRDPATWFQALETRLGHNLFPSDIKTSYAYDALGEVRSPQNVGTIFNMFSPETPEKAERGHSPEHSAVMLEMDRLAQVAGATFTSISPKQKETGSLDLRTMMTKDGTETLFDRLNRNYRDLNPAAILAPIAQSRAADGTYKYQGEKTAALQTTINTLRAAAMGKLLTEEDVRNRMVLESTNKARALGGQMDYGNVNK